MSRDQAKAPTGAADRVPLAQASARRSIAVGGLFVVAAAITALLGAGEGRWLPLHLFMAGALVAIIGGASTLFTVTWSAAPAPSATVMWTQRGLCAAGAVLVVSARVLEWGDAALWAGAVVFIAGLVLLASVLVMTVRQGVKRRFDTAVAWYVCALIAAVVAATIGGDLGTGGATIGLRNAHVVLNLLGFIGLITAGTLPSFIATVGRTKMSSRSTEPVLRALLAAMVVGVAAASVGYVIELRWASVFGLGIYAAGLVFLATRLPRPTRRSLDWAGPRLLALWLGMGWWTVAVAFAAVDTAREGLPLADNWTLVLVVAAYGQILWGALAYLLPVLQGPGHEALTRGFAAVRSWVGLVAVNVAGLAWVADQAMLARVAVAVWLADGAFRLARFGLGIVSHRPEDTVTSGT
ncbi:MAG: hypothetical protein ABI239_12315 [Aquihabitans sp.]